MNVDVRLKVDLKTYRVLQAQYKKELKNATVPGMTLGKNAISFESWLSCYLDETVKKFSSPPVIDI